MKPFDLEAALKGAPCITRDGRKAWVIGLVPEEFMSKCPLVGGVADIDCKETETFSIRKWAKDGHYLTFRESDIDLVGMWEEPPIMRHLNGYKFPAPCVVPLKARQVYFIPMIDGSGLEERVWGNNLNDELSLANGLVHLTREAAAQHTLALLAVAKGEPCTD